jgi:LacI family transcriptional regulator
MAERLTLEKIGELAGVSRATVSRVVNEHPGVRSQVRQRVLEVIQETGYQPNLAARSLASNRMGIIGLVIPYGIQYLFTDPYFPRLLQGMTQVCNLNDYTLSLFLLHTEDEEKKLYPRVFNPSYLDGVILASSENDSPLIDRLQKSGLPFIMVGRPDDSSHISYIDVDNEIGAYTAVAHLIRQGRKRIATITGRQNMSSGMDRLAGYLNALTERGLSVDESLIANGYYSESEAFNAMLRLLPQKPDAVFVASDGMALGALRALQKANISIPNEIAIVSFDDLSPAITTAPPLTTIKQPVRRMGALAAETLLDIIEDGSGTPRRIILPTELVIRQSCGAFA